MFVVISLTQNILWKLSTFDFKTFTMIGGVFMDSKQPVPKATHHDLFEAWTYSSDAAEATMIMEATIKAIF